MDAQRVDQLAAVAISWIGLFALSVVLTIYDDHMNLSGAAVRIRKDGDGYQKQLRVALAAKDNSIGEIKTRCAVQEGINNTLQNQNRDQQRSINGCLTKALDFLKPEAFKQTMLTLDNPKQENAAMKGARWLILTNKHIPSVKMLVTCDLSISSLDVEIVGSAIPLGGKHIERLFPNQLRIAVSSPAWSPVSPLLISAQMFDEHTTCRFSPEL